MKELASENVGQFAKAIEKVPPTEFISAVEERIRFQESKSAIAHRWSAMRFLFCIYGFAVMATFSIIFLQGFNAWGFKLSESFLQWLGGAIIGELGIIAGVVFTALFKKRSL